MNGDDERMKPTALRSALFVTTVPVTLEAFLLPFADHLRSSGWSVDAMARGASENPAVLEHFDNVFDVAWSRNPLSPRNIFGTTRRVRHVAQEGRYSVVHVHTPIAAWVTRYALRSLSDTVRPAIIYTAHGFHFHTRGKPVANLVYRTMERLAARWTDVLVTINDEDFAAARAFGTIDPGSVRLVRGIGVDTERFAPAESGDVRRRAIRAELGISEEAVLVTMVAEMAPVKRHRLAIDALGRVKNERLTLLLVGEGPLEHALRDLVIEQGLKDRVRFAGHRADVDTVLAASDTLLLCSEREGLARCVLEAMATGIPVIGTDTRGITDAVGDVAGWIVGHDDVKGLADALDALASDAEERTARGAAGRTRAEAEFSLPRIIAAYDELYEEALNSRG